MASSGKELWKTDDPRETIVQEYFNDNGIFGEEKITREDIFAYQVDRTRTTLSDFHTWADTLAKKSCEHVWRPFFWIGESCGKPDSWGWKEEVDQLKLDPFFTIGEIWGLLAEV